VIAQLVERETVVG